ncbi:hypothetical protein PP1_020025 [Pseudonocardia sp. P1]
MASDAKPGGIPTPRRERTFNPGNTEGKVVVQLGKADVEGPWCLSRITPDDHVALLQRIASVESMTVREVFNTSGGGLGVDYQIDALPNAEAVRRLVTLEYDDETQISRIRVSGTGRLFGFRKGERFYVLWWDPLHEIWPSQLKHT